MMALNPDVRVRSGFLAPLLEALEEPEVIAATPRVLADGDDQRPESHNALRYDADPDAVARLADG